MGRGKTEWDKVERMGQGWTGLDRVGRGWTGLDGVGWGWTGLVLNFKNSLRIIQKHFHLNPLMCKIILCLIAFHYNSNVLLELH